MIRIEDKTYWIYSIETIVEKSATKVKYFLRGIKGEGMLNSDLLLKDIDKDIQHDVLLEIAQELFNIALKRHSKENSGTVVISDLLPEGTESIIFKTNNFNEVDKIEYCDSSMFTAICESFCYRWMEANGSEIGVNFFGAKMTKAKTELLSNSLNLTTAEKQYKPIY